MMVNCDYMIQGYGYCEQKIILIILNIFIVISKFVFIVSITIFKKLKSVIEIFQKYSYNYNNKDNLIYFINMIVRSLFTRINETLFRGYVALIFGTRRVGKTTLLEEIIRYQESMGRKIRYLNCDLISARQMIDTTNDQELKSLVEGIDILAIDEAQNIETIGRTLKIIHDTFPKLQVIATGSSSFDLANKTGEPLVGRMRQFLLYPFSIKEIWKEKGPLEATANLENFLKYGLYPKVYGINGEEAKIELEDMVSGYLYKDLLTFEGIRNSSQILSLLQSLALQVGSEVSFHELAGKLNLSLLTIKKYIDLLEKCYIVFTLPALSRNMRNEIAGNRTRKIYFYDIGVRNALLGDYKDMELRPDAGGIWENFCIVELKKKAQRERRHTRYYFWRTISGREVDLIEEENGEFNLYEFKLSANKKAKLPKGFAEHYSVKSFNVINKENWYKYF